MKLLIIQQSTQEQALFRIQMDRFCHGLLGLAAFHSKPIQSKEYAWVYPALGEFHCVLVVGSEAKLPWKQIESQLSDVKMIALAGDFSSADEKKALQICKNTKKFSDDRFKDL